MKKLLNIFLCLSMIFQNFMWAMPVKALEEKEKIEIKSISQNGEDLKLENGVYQVDNLTTITGEFHIANYNSAKSYKMHIKSSNDVNATSIQTLDNDVFWDNLGLDYQNAQTTITYELYDITEEETVLDTLTVTLNFTKFDDYNLDESKLYIEEMTQGGKEVTKDENNVFTFNDKQDITLKIKGEGFATDTEYPLYYNHGMNFLGNYKGADLNKEFTITIPIYDLSFKDINVSISFDAFKTTGVINAKPAFCKELSYCNYDVKFSSDIEVPTYEIKSLKYVSHPDVLVNPIEKFAEYYHNMYIVSSRYHDKENPLAISIQGNNYQEQDYTVKVDIVRDGKNVYTHDFQVNGSALNNGYDLVLSGFASNEAKEYVEDKDKYIVKINIDYITRETNYMYGVSTNYSTVNSEIFFENGKKNLSTFKGDGDFYYSSGFADTNKDAFQKYGKIYIRYLGSNFEENLEYDYKLSYGYSDNMGGLKDFETLEEGKITGQKLNEEGLTFAVDNHKNHTYPVYKFEVSYNGEVIYYSAPVIYLVDFPTFANVSLTNGNNKDLYLKMDDYSYVATRNFPINLTISGVGFEDSENYEVTYEATYKTKDGNFNSDGEQKVVFSGKELNEGTATINLNKKITDDIVSAGVSAYYSKGNGYGQGSFNIEFVDSKDLFPQENPYLVDNGLDLIKNIKDNTNVTDFINSMQVNNGSIEIYDKTGTEKQNNILGTGMIARIFDENNNVILDLDVVVKGDVSGDGVITVTDLVKTKQHIAEVNSLDGAYKVAGDVTDTGEITITDLVKLSQDVAEIKDVN